MFKKGVILVILFSMMLHCASRVGFLSYLYEERHNIAHTIGFIAEVPIALCSNDYDFDPTLKIQSQEESDQSIPPHVFQAKELQLFFSRPTVEPTLSLTILRENQIPGVLKKAYYPPSLSIFHPPS